MFFHIKEGEYYMEKLHKQTLQKLLVASPGIKVTIYVPIHTTASPPHISENQIRLKNLSHKAIEELKARRNYELAEQLTNVINETTSNIDFWKQQTPGLLVCIAENFSGMYHLPVDTEEYVAIDNQFHLAPLLGLISDEHQFYVLELAEHNPRLLKGDMYGLEVSSLKLPTNISEVINGHTEKQNSMHAVQHNISAGYPSRFFRIIDSVICESIDNHIPLILAGTDTETAEFREISHFPKILHKAVSNSYDKGHLNDLFLKVKNIIDLELVGPEHRDATEEYMRLEKSEPNRVVNDEQSIFKAAEQGRIDKLFTNLRRETSDNVQDSLSPTTRITFLDPRLNSFINKLTLKVWQMRGLILNLQSSEMPASAPVVAKLRY